MSSVGDSIWTDVAGWIGVLSLAFGVVILALAFLGARARFSRPTAFTMLGVSILLAGGAFVAMHLGMLGTFDEAATAGPAVRPSDMTSGMGTALLYAGMAALGALLGVIGSLRALTALEPSDESASGTPPAPLPVT